MSQLVDLQQKFQRAILELTDVFNGEIVATEKVDIPTRIGIYSNAYRARLVETMEDSYDALHTLLGDDQFYKLCHAYIDTHPSHHYSIRWYGDKLADFTRRTSPYNEHPYVAELAEFQWKLMEAFDARDVPPVSVEDMAAVSPEQWPGMRLMFQPSLRRLDIEWDVPAFWTAVNEDKEPSGPPQRGEARTPWVIWRKELMQYFRSMDNAEAWALDRAVQGGSFAELCEGLCEWHSEDDVATHAAGLLKRWIVDTMVVCIDTGPD